MAGKNTPKLVSIGSGSTAPNSTRNSRDSGSVARNFSIFDLFGSRNLEAGTKALQQDAECASKVYSGLPVIGRY